MTKFEKKRKVDSTAEPGKRQRASSIAVAKPPPNTANDALAKPTPEICFGANPSPNAETLAKELNGIPFHLWVNLHAVKLFMEVDVSCPC